MTQAVVPGVPAKATQGTETQHRDFGWAEASIWTDRMKEMEHWRPTAGTPQGAVISPLLANIYLHPLDRLMEESGYRMVRYADDGVPRTH
jgi:RNA-directed DNA polymerase